MAGWAWVVALNFVTAASYGGIAYFIVRGLASTGQLRRNHLAVATSAIFVTCAAHHLFHAINLIHDGDAMQTSMMREMMGQSIDVVVTASTAITGVLYLALRRSYGMLLKSPALFDNATEARYRQLAASLPCAAVSVFDHDFRYILVAGSGLEGLGYERSAMEGHLIPEVVPTEVWTKIEHHLHDALEGRSSEFDHASTVTGVIFHHRIGPLRDEANGIIGGLVVSEDVSAERLLHEELHAAQAFNAAVLAASPDITVVSDMERGEATWASRSIMQLLGWPAGDSWAEEGPQLRKLVFAEDQPRLASVNETVAALPDGESITIRLRMRGATGPRWITRQSTPFLRENGKVVSYLSVVRDITDMVEVEHRIQEQLSHAEAFNAAVLAASPDITMISSLETGDVTWASRSVLDLLGWPPSESWADESSRFNDLVNVEDKKALARADNAIARLPDGESVTFRMKVRAAQGTRWLSRQTTPFRRDENGRLLSHLSVLRDVTDVVEVERRMEHAALHDPLTGLPNRALLLDRLTSTLARADRLASEVAVLFCDLDGFKKINDTHGHAAGDAVLIEVAGRLAGLIRKSDSVARVGGDEFVVILEPAPADPADGDLSELRQIASSVANRVRTELSRPIVVDGMRHNISVSVGMTFAPRRSTAPNVLRDADLALYRAKQRGKDRVEVFDESLGADAVERSRVESVLRQALETDRPGPPALTVAYQPVYDLADNLLVGFEALARLVDPAGNPIPPDSFIPVAEETGMIAPVGERVLDDALACLAGWRAAHPDDRPATMAVNLSARQAQQADMPQVVQAALARHHLEPSDLILELTESVLLESGTSTLRQLTELRDCGVGIAIDDFGTGYASLRYLATLPVSSVKVDRSFTATITSDRTSASIVHAILNLAGDLGLDCVVEGLETREQIDALHMAVHGQGYLLGRPTALPQDTWLTAAI